MRKLLLILLLSNVALAADPITKGDKAPYDGVIFKHDEAVTLKKDLIDLDMLNKQRDIYKQNEAIMSSQVDLWRNQALNLSKELTKEKHSFWSNTAFFFLGAAATTVIVFGVRRSLQ